MSRFHVFQALSLATPPFELDDIMQSEAPVSLLQRSRRNIFFHLFGCCFVAFFCDIWAAHCWNLPECDYAGSAPPLTRSDSWLSWFQACQKRARCRRRRLTAQGETSSKSDAKTKTRACKRLIKMAEMYLPVRREPTTKAAGLNGGRNRQIRHRRMDGGSRLKCLEPCQPDPPLQDRRGCKSLAQVEGDNKHKGLNYWLGKKKKEKKRRRTTAFFNKKKSLYADLVQKGRVNR